MSAAHRSLFSTAASIKETAADWVARRNGGLSSQEEAELQQWLSMNPRHAAAFENCEGAWATITHPRRAGFTDIAWRELTVRRRRRTFRQVACFGTASIAVVAALVFIPGPFRSAGLVAVPAATIAVRPNLQTLPDGSTAELNTGAEIVVDYSPDWRRVKVTRGEVLFEVVKDRGRPFIVVAGEVEVQAVGTAFSVRFDRLKVGVLVTEGRVAITPTPEVVSRGSVPQAEPVYVSAGGKVEVLAKAPAAVPHSVQPLTADEISSALAWRGKRVEFSGTRLPEALEWFNRHNRVQLSLGDPALVNRRISGIFWIDDPIAFVRLIETGLSLRADRSGDVIVLKGY